MPALAFELWRGLTAASGAIGGTATVKMDGSPDFARSRAAVEHVGQIAHDLAWLAREVAEARKITHPVLNTATAPLQALQVAATWLTLHAPWMLERPEAPDWHGTLTGDRRTALKLINRPERGVIALDDACPDCGASLKAKMHDVDDPRPNEVWCTGPEPHRFGPEQWRRLGQRLAHAKEAG